MVCRRRCRGVGEHCSTGTSAGVRRQSAAEFGVSVVLNNSAAQQHPQYGTWAKKLHDGLNLGACGVSPPERTDVRVPKGPSWCVCVRVCVCARDTVTARDDGDLVVYVSPKGDDVKGDGSPASPFASLSRALTAGASRDPDSTTLRGACGVPASVVRWSRTHPPHQ